MTTPAGAISLNDVNVELKRPATQAISMNDWEVQQLAGWPAGFNTVGAISMSHLQNRMYARYGTSVTAHDWNQDNGDWWCGYKLMTAGVSTEVRLATPYGTCELHEILFATKDNGAVSNNSLMMTVAYVDSQQKADWIIAKCPTVITLNTYRASGWGAWDSKNNQLRSNLYWGTRFYALNQYQFAIFP